MSTFKFAEATPSSTVATGGAINFAYPEGTNAGSFASYDHKAYARGLQNLLLQPQDFTLAFGASYIVMTYLGATTIPAYSVVSLQLNEPGEDDGRPDSVASVKRSTLLPMVKVDLGAPDEADDNGVAVSQTVTGEGASFLLNGALVADGKAVFDVPRNVVAAWTNTAVLTITGEDEYGNAVVETSVSGTGHTGKKAFKKVVSVKTSATITGAIVGTGDVLGLPVFLPAKANVVAELEDGALQPRKTEPVVLTGRMLEAAVDAGTAYNIVSPVAGRIAKLTTISQGSITTGGNVTVEVNTVAVDGLTVVVANSAVEGEVDSDTPTPGHATAVVAVGDRIAIIPASAFDASADIYFVLEIEPVQTLKGLAVAGSQATPSGVTGDVRGTYDPAVACDGSKAFSLWLALPDPAYLGTAQYAG